MNELTIPVNATDAQELLARFAMTCKRCGGTDVVVNLQESGGYSDYTQWGASVQIGCNACKLNDWSASL